MNFFVTPDIHGCLDPLNHLLRKWRPDKETFIQLGDMVDRGPNSLGVIQKMMVIHKEYEGVMIKGNHEEMFLYFLDEPEEEADFYFSKGGRETVDSFFSTPVAYLRTPTYIAEYIKTNYAEEVAFLKNLREYYSYENWVFVHAGVNLKLRNWENSTESNLRWKNDLFLYEKNESENCYVFGHTPTQNLHRDQRTEVWISPCKTKFGLDGGIVYGGQLNAMRITGKEYEFVSVGKDEV
ncbi:hypothetical protein CN918_26970 [Priestia megaterium]|nr:hypothetical protein CN918_26970 [Priestia megaterium]